MTTLLLAWSQATTQPVSGFRNDAEMNSSNKGWLPEITAGLANSGGVIGRQCAMSEVAYRTGLRSSWASASETISIPCPAKRTLVDDPASNKAAPALRWAKAGVAPGCAFVH